MLLVGQHEEHLARKSLLQVKYSQNLFDGLDSSQLRVTLEKRPRK